MATTEQIFDVRLRLSDPAGFIQFIESALPESPEPQTAYMVSGVYYSTEKPSCALTEDYSIEDLRVSDIRISTWIDLNGSDYATCQSLKAFLPQIGKEMQLTKNSTGAESVEYQALKDTYYYYKDLLALCSEEKKSNDGNSSGRYLGSVQPEIGGGNL